MQVRLVREAMQASGLSTAEGARLLSAFHRITADAEIAAFDAKYTYFDWRPITALQVDDDGDPSTPQDQRLESADQDTRAPGLPQRPHRVRRRGRGRSWSTSSDPHPHARWSSTAASSDDNPRTYTTWQQAVDENEDARVWAGIHFRTSDEVGSELGRLVAEYGLGRL